MKPEAEKKEAPKEVTVGQKVCPTCLQFAKSLGDGKINNSPKSKTNIIVITSN